MLDPELFSDDRLAQCSSFGLTLYMGLLCSCDVEGRLEDRPAKIKAKLFPYFDVNVNEVLTLLSTQGFIIRYRSGGHDVIQIVGFTEKGLSYNNEKSYGLPAYVESKDEVLEATDQLVANCNPADSQLNINNNIIYNNNITRGECEGGDSKPKSKTKPKNPDLGILTLPKNLEPVRVDVESWISYKIEKGKPYKPLGLRALLSELSKFDAETVRASIRKSMSSNWDGLFPEKSNQNKNLTGYASQAERTQSMIDRVISEEEARNG